MSRSTAPASTAPARPHAQDELNPFDDKVAVKVHCPECGALDWFEWKFLGRLTDPVCGHTWYVGSGFYIAMQIRAAFAAGGRFAKHLTSGVSGEGAWIAKALGWFMGIILGLAIRLEFGVLMIPVQALVGLFQANKAKSDMVIRVVVLCAFVTAVGIGAYEIKNPSIQPAGLRSASVPVMSSTALPTSPPSVYSVSVTVEDRTTRATLIVNGQETVLAEGDIGRFAILSFNGPRDIMWLACLAGQTLAEARSSTGSKVVRVPMLNDANIEPAPGKSNNLIVTCKQ